MVEWINSNQCIIYINNILQYKEPTKILRIVYSLCKELYKFIKLKEQTNSEEDNNNQELIELRENKIITINKVTNLKSCIRGINTTIGILKSQVNKLDNDITDILDIYTTTILDSNYILFDEWWEKNFEKTEEEIILSSKEIWNRFKQENKDLLVNMDLNIDNLKQFIKLKLTSDNYIIKGKGGNGGMEIKGYKWKEHILEQKIVEQKIEKTFENKKIKIKTDPLMYISEEVDNRILNFYNVEMLDIFEISTKENIEIYQVVSCLMKHKIIKKRDEARGYDKYKETAEYKSKLKNAK
jgi:hypothetical protein